jgi:hypothetical protein
MGVSKRPAIMPVAGRSGLLAFLGGRSNALLRQVLAYCPAPHLQPRQRLNESKSGVRLSFLECGNFRVFQRRVLNKPIKQEILRFDGVSKS